ncbi:MAG: hypothetical protein H6576_13145 [Lewinellaceae bacterium]|nr:hypothetical protein [Lewinellaceae bacterium]
MPRFLLIALFLGFAIPLLSQSPHGSELKIDCAACHNSSSWEISAAYWQSYDPYKPGISKTTGMPWGPDTLRFNHDKTEFALKGQHALVDCRACHQTLIFSEAPSDCATCHQDMHQQTLGNDCARCHNTDKWLVDNITDLHQQNGFPLTGVHTALDCNQCHINASGLQFERIGNDCINCHRQDYAATTNPNHQQAGFSTDCQECHDLSNPGWGTDKVSHDFFPLTKGHEISDCKQCHTTGDFASTSPVCNSCHQTNFNNTLDPNHVAAGFPNDCAACHTTDPDWMPAEYIDHDAAHFPIYSGTHMGEWQKCSECHLNANNYAEYSCTVCHKNPETDDGHQGISGYVYDDNACLACHPSGNTDDAFDHNNTGFPLTGAHTTVNCNECHANGYAGTPTACEACHLDNFNQTSNPNHVALQMPTDCAMCHTTDPGWAPAQFPIHDDYYVLKGAHADIANDCATCHNGAYNNTPNTCIGCHTADFNQTTDPNHSVQQLSTDCTQCHSEDAWVPSSFDHNAIYPFTGAHIAIADDCNACHHGDYNNTPNTCNGCHNGDFVQTTNPNHQNLNLPTDCAMCHTTDPGWSPATFPIHNDFYVLNGAHMSIANDCAACHQGNYNNTPNTCNGCHADDFNQTTDPNHSVQQFSTNCTTCHTETAWVPSTFDHNSIYPFTGAHIAIADDCNACHHGDYSNTPNTCNGCHSADYVQTANPNHSSLNLSTDCATCHTTDPGWSPAAFPIHDDFYVLNGAHIQIANDCAACHNGNYINTPNTCFGCHTADFNQTTDPNHAQLNFSTDCTTCHTESAWTPSTFDHDVQNFPIYSGKHAGLWTSCTECHTNPSNYQEYTCITCHINPETNDHHVGIAGYNYSSPACFACHPNGSADDAFDHNNTGFPLTGAHTQVNCLECHANGYAGTPTKCSSCHVNDFNQTVNPNHLAANIPMECDMCHTTDPGWSPATFPIHNDYYVLNGAHVPIANDCAACHNGDYNNTPNTCNGCHNADYQQVVDPNHAAQQFPADCAQCHTETAWTPSTFDHNAFFPFTGAHIPIADDCNACHQGNYNNTPNTCVGCHTADYNQSLNPNHQAINIPTDCAMCHTTDPGWSPATFPIHNDYYVFNGAHIAIADDCAACHNGDYNNTPNTCFGCHSADYNQTTNPDHEQAQFPTDCALCHSETAWVPSTFDHNAIYPFTGAHIAIANDCDACHHGDFNNTPNTCNGCHNADYVQSLNPNHQAINIPTDCAMCHTTDPGWAPATFPIHNDYYVFNGAHIAIADDCAACHNGDYNNTPNTCIGCHTADYQGVSDPNHAVQQFPMDCTTCHSESSWVPASFDHSQYYPFTGAHIAIADDCNACHNGDYNNTPNTCVGCHTPDYNQSLNPNHQAINIPTDCEMCHTTDPGWAPATFPIHDDYYVLNGAHIAIANDCATCHNGDYNNTPNTCFGCHSADYNQTTNPDHEQAQFPTDCVLCHTETAWVPSTFDHNAIYPFTGAHIAIADDCYACHNGDFNNTPNTCVGCHSDNYNQSLNPNHQSLNIPTDCDMCHTTDPGWAPATFPIHDDYYVLNGAHIAIADDCAACHNGDYNNTPNTCVGCHAADYQGTNDPNHVVQQFPMDCTQCHSEDAWIPSSFDHNTIYPFTGAHIAIADDCNACHNGDYNNTPNTCVGCHTADYNQSLNPNHQAINIPTDCAMCHTTDPGWAPATFPIHNDYYVLNGAHIAIANDCAQCHNGDYNNTPNTCYGCHTSDYQGASDPNHSNQQFPTDCAYCHTEDSWDPVNYNHDQQYFPIYTGKHKNEWDQCIDCHTTPGDFVFFNCINCHHNAHHQNQGNAGCYSCHPDGKAD